MWGGTLIPERGLHLSRRRPTLPHTCGADTLVRQRLEYATAYGALTRPAHISTLAVVEVHFRPETESRLQELSAKSGRAPDDLVEDAMAGYLQELAQVREMLDSRYDDLKSGRVKPVDGEEAFASLRRKSKNRKGDNNARHTSRS